MARAVLFKYTKNKEDTYERYAVYIYVFSLLIDDGQNIKRSARSPFSNSEYYSIETVEEFTTSIHFDYMVRLYLEKMKEADDLAPYLVRGVKM